MAAVPNHIAETLEVAVQSSEPVAAAKPRKPKQATPKAATPATEQPGAAKPVVSAPVDGTVTASAKPAAAANEAPAREEAKSYKTPWYVVRADRSLQARASQSFVFLTKKLTLNTHHAQEILQRCMEDWSAAMITLSETMRNFKREEDCVVVDAEVDRHLDSCFAAVKASVVRLKKMAETHGLDMDEVEIEYSMPSTNSLKVLSPREMRFHSLLAELDALCTLTDKMWLVKLLSDRDRSQIPFTTKRQIIGMVNRVRTLVYRAQASTQRAAAAKAQAEQAQTTGTDVTAAAATPEVAVATAPETAPAEAVTA